MNTRQYVYDQLKKSRETGQAELTLRGKRMLIRPVDPGMGWGGFHAIVKSNVAPYKVDIAYVYEKDGLVFTFEEARPIIWSRKGQWDEVLATVEFVD